MPSIDEANEQSLTRQLISAEAEIERLKKIFSQEAVRAAALEASAELGEVAPLVANLVAEQLQVELDERGFRVVAVDVNGRKRLSHGAYGSSPLTARDVLREVKQMPVVRRLLDSDGEQPSEISKSDHNVSLTEASRRAAQRVKADEARELEGLKRICSSANPFLPEHRNLTIASRLMQLDPKYARKLQQEAAFVRGNPETLLESRQVREIKHRASPSSS